MDTSKFLAVNYPELAELLTQRLSATPEPQPLDISEWLAMSLLQKSIRRGETGHALRAAASLLRNAPDRLWKRLAVAAYEDISMGDLNIVTPVLIATSGKGIRQKFGGDWAVASALVERMAAARKDRSADDLLMSVPHPAYEADRLGLTYKTNAELMRIVSGTEDIITRAIALFYLTGTDRCPVPSMRVRKGSYPYAVGMMEQTGFPFCVLELARRGISRMREPLPIFVALLSREVPRRHDGFQPTEKNDDFLPATMIGDIPSWSVDWYVREGRAAIRAFLRHDTPTGRWLKANVAPPDRAEVLGGLVFRAEGGLLRRRLQWPTGEYLRKVMETEAVGFGITDATEVLDLLRNDLPLLNEERRHVL